MCVVAIVGSGPVGYLPDLSSYETEVDVWIGADRGALALIERGITVDFAVGDFDSVTTAELAKIKEQSKQTKTYAAEKDETDLEIALLKAFNLHANKIYLFGVTGGRLDHALVNLQLLQTINEKGVQGIIVDQWNQVELKTAGRHRIVKNELYKYVSLVPFTQNVQGITLKGFLYPLMDYDVSVGSTTLISNELMNSSGTVSFKAGSLLVVQSRDNEAE